MVKFVDRKFLKSTHSTIKLCPYCKSRGWKRQSRGGHDRYKYICTNCKKHFTKLLIRYLVTDSNVLDNSIIECPSCRRTMVFVDSVVKNSNAHEIIVECECKEVKIYMKFDYAGNRVINMECNSNIYLENMIKNNIE